jgi:hypothetical protein
MLLEREVEYPRDSLMDDLEMGTLLEDARALSETDERILKARKTVHEHFDSLIHQGGVHDRACIIETERERRKWRPTGDRQNHFRPAAVCEKEENP